MTEKAVLRAQMRAARDAFFAAGTVPIKPPSAFLDRLHRGIVVASYWAIGSEADPVAFDGAVRRAGGVLAMPHVTTRAEPMRFLRWDEGVPLVPGRLGLQQPPVDAAQLVPDLIITPLLAFDRSRNRLGQGAGYYDRAFAAFPNAWRMGLAWSVQQVDALPVDPWDVPLHLIVTETEVIA